MTWKYEDIFNGAQIIGNNSIHVSCCKMTVVFLYIVNASSIAINVYLLWYIYSYPAWIRGNYLVAAVSIQYLYIPCKSITNCLYGIGPYLCYLCYFLL